LSRRAVSSKGPTLNPRLRNPWQNGSSHSQTLSESDLYDTDGVILPLATILLVVIVGLSVLALDGARSLSLQTQVQNGADQIALAGAAELDGSPSAITRADNAVAAATNNTDFAHRPYLEQVRTSMCPVTHRYLSALPANDQTHRSRIPGHVRPVECSIYRGDGHAGAYSNYPSCFLFWRLNSVTAGLLL